MNKFLIIGIVIFIVFVMAKKKPPSESPKPESPKPSSGNQSNRTLSSVGKLPIEEQIKIGLKGILDAFGLDTARTVERIYRLETSHFKSGQFLKTFSPGMEKHSDNYPFGWSSMKGYWDSVGLVPSFYTMPENKTGISKTFVSFPDVPTAMNSLAYYVKKYSPERWYSTNPESQAKYRASLDSIVPRITNSLV